MVLDFKTSIRAIVFVPSKFILLSLGSVRCTNREFNAFCVTAFGCPSWRTLILVLIYQTLGDENLPHGRPVGSLMELLPSEILGFD